MAVESEVLLKVNAVEAANTVKDLRDSMKDLRKVMNETTLSNEDYKKASDALATAQMQLTNITKLGTKEASKAGESYNQLSRRMAELTSEYKAATSEMSRNELAKQIKTINDRLKEMDASRGVFGRNVGDYANQMTAAFQQTAGAAGAVVAPIQRATGALNVLKAHPVIAALGLLASLVLAVSNAMKKSEDATLAWRRALSAFKPIGDLVTKVLQGIGTGIAIVIEKIADFVQWTGILGDRSKEYQRLEEEEIAIAKEKRELLIEEARLQKQIAQLRADAADKSNKSGKESVALLKEAIALEEELATKKTDFAKREAQFITDKNALMPSSTEELNQEADAWAKVEQEQTKVLAKQREYNAQLFEAGNRDKAETATKEKANLWGGDSGDAIFKSAEDDWLLEVEEQYYKEEALMQEHIDEMGRLQKEKADEQVRLAKEEAEKKKTIGDIEKKWEKEKFNYMANLASAASQLAGQETAVGKGLALASTAISTYSAAQKAYESQFLPVPTTSSPVRGALAAAGAVVSGLANMKAILSVKAEKMGSAGASASFNGASVSTYAPAIVQQVPVTRSLTGASEEARLNQIADGVNKPVKAYVVGSEMQGQLLYDQQTEDEASF